MSLKAPEHSRRIAGVHPTLVDLAFVLVFLFLILSSLARVTPTNEGTEARLPALHLPALPESTGAGAPAAVEQHITLLADGVLLLEQTPMADTATLCQRLKDTLATSVTLRAEASVPYEQIAALLGQLHQTGIREVSLAYLPYNH